LNSKQFETDFPTETVKEGKVHVVVPKLEAYVKEPSDYAPSKAPVFYNPVMELNRDITVLAFQAYQRTVNREISVCEPLTSSGIRGVRFAAEIHGIKEVLVNDISLRAVNLANRNVQLNNLQERVTVNHGDANCLLSCHGAPHKRFDIVDLDPFGSPVPYLDSALRALRDGGFLAATATDLAPLCGVHAKACVRKYGGRPLRTEYCHELAVRLLAGCIASVAAKHEIAIRILFSHSTDHYVRVYGEIGYGAKKADESVKNLGYVLHCFNCLHRETATAPFVTRIENCPECGSRMDYAGPLWLGKIFNKQFCEEMLGENAHRALRNSARIAKLLALATDEAEAPPTYYVIDKICNKLGLPVPSVATILRTMHENGFVAVPTHFNSRGIKTNASATTMQNLVKSQVGKNKFS
jgi:tRNA (guanine26-N2/guanine27-N2)-dimethyltransferase